MSSQGIQCQTITQSQERHVGLALCPLGLGSDLTLSYLHLHCTDLSVPRSYANINGSEESIPREKLGSHMAEGTNGGQAQNRDLNATSHRHQGGTGDVL